MSKRQDYRQPVGGRPLWDNKAYRPDIHDPFKSQKKHYESHHESEINRFAVMKGTESLNPQIATNDYPRNLATYDIPGAIPARKNVKQPTTPIRSSSIDAQGYDISGGKGYSNFQNDDALDLFKKEYELQKKDSRSGRREGHQLRASYDMAISNNNNTFPRNDPQQQYRDDLYQGQSQDFQALQKEMFAQDNYSQNKEDNIKIRDYSANRNAKKEHVPFANILNLTPNKGKSDNLYSHRETEVTREQLDTNESPNRRMEWRNPDSTPMYKLPERPVMNLRGSQDLRGNQDITMNNINNITGNGPNNISNISSSPVKAYNNLNTKNVLTYNIISNNPQARNLPTNTRLPFKYALDFETTRIQNEMKRYSMPDMDPTSKYVFDQSTIQKPSPQKDVSKIDDQYQAKNQNIFADNSNNAYNKYSATPTPYDQGDSNNSQFVNPKSLKNLSGIKIY